MSGIGAFFDAVKAGQVSEAEDLIAGNPAWLTAADQSEYGSRALNLAVRRCDHKMAEMLLQRGADVDLASDWWAGPYTPLIDAIHAKDQQMIELLLNAGAEIGIHEACGLGRSDLVQSMIDRDPELVNQRGGDGVPPLAECASNECADILLRAGADIEMRCLDHQSTPLQHLCTMQPAAARHLIDRGAQHCLIIAAACGHVDCIKQLLADNPDQINISVTRENYPTDRDDLFNILWFSVGENCTALHAAASAGHEDAVKLFLESGADPHARGGYDNANPAHAAAWNNHAKCLRVLAAGGADMNALSGEIHTNSPLGWAIVAGSLDSVSALLDLDVEVLPFFLDEAEAGCRGDFQAYSRRPIQNWEQIRDLLLKRQSV